MDCNLRLKHFLIAHRRTPFLCAKHLPHIPELDQIESRCRPNNCIELVQPHHLRMQLTLKA
ncbi:unnamed protein product [Cylicostephanus goldi]|uniref:Uncharacterized protein n=1 Tax=Cylicostephanus goldi TaxID=71465 RepID=A0A3P6RYS1_CYLGO|nr:unnamed protein product [Cylicostephanus goldi]